jgi:hypothetical protein
MVKMNSLIDKTTFWVGTHAYYVLEKSRNKIGRRTQMKDIINRFKRSNYTKSHVGFCRLMQVLTRYRNPEDILAQPVNPEEVWLNRLRVLRRQNTRVWFTLMYVHVVFHRLKLYRETSTHNFGPLTISTAYKNHIKRFFDVESIIDHFLMMSDAGETNCITSEESWQSKYGMW